VECHAGSLRSQRQYCGSRNSIVAELFNAAHSGFADALELEVLALLSVRSVCCVYWFRYGRKISARLLAGYSLLPRLEVSVIARFCKDMLPSAGAGFAGGNRCCSFLPVIAGVERCPAALGLGVICSRFLAMPPAAGRWLSWEPPCI